MDCLLMEFLHVHGALLESFKEFVIILCLLVVVLVDQGRLEHCLVPKKKLAHEAASFFRNLEGFINLLGSIQVRVLEVVIGTLVVLGRTVLEKGLLVRGVNGRDEIIFLNGISLLDDTL